MPNNQVGKQKNLLEFLTATAQARQNPFHVNSLVFFLLCVTGGGGGAGGGGGWKIRIL
jgi:hypothetical protein